MLIEEERSNSGDSDEEEKFEEEFYEITTSEGEPYTTSEEEDAELLQVALESAYTCSPFKQGRDPASYLLLDKDLMDEEEIGTCCFVLLIIAFFYQLFAIAFGGTRKCILLVFR